MMNRFGKTRDQGFTLVELLVVIAIIGILAGLLFPAIKGAMDKAKGVKLGNNARQIQIGVFTANTEREALSYSAVWPQTLDAAEPFYAATSTEYFKDLATSDVVEGMETSMFAGDKCANAGNWSDFEAKYNMWKVVANLSDTLPDTIPFIFSRNIDWGSDNLVDVPLGTVERLTLKPFTDDGLDMPFGIVVTKGGGVKVLRDRYLFGNEFIGSGSRSNLTDVVAVAP